MPQNRYSETSASRTGLTRKLRSPAPSHIPNQVSRLQALRHEQETDTFIYSGPSHVP